MLALSAGADPIRAVPDQLRLESLAGPIGNPISGLPVEPRCDATTRLGYFAFGSWFLGATLVGYGLRHATENVPPPDDNPETALRTTPCFAAVVLTRYDHAEEPMGTVWPLESVAEHRTKLTFL